MGGLTVYPKEKKQQNSHYQYCLDHSYCFLGISIGFSSSSTYGFQLLQI